MAVEWKRVYMEGGTDVAVADGGTGQSTAQAAIDALTQVSGASEGQVLAKDEDGHATFQSVSGITQAEAIMWAIVFGG